MVSGQSEGIGKISEFAHLIVVDGDHDVTILDTSEDGQDVRVLIENDVAPRTRVGLRGSCRNSARERDVDQGTYVSHDCRDQQGFFM